jgi:putative solute:sodium symporter small subunit
MTPPTTDDAARRRWQICLRVTAWLLVIGFAVTFGVAFFARQLSFSVFGWPLSFWVASQGALVVYLALVCFYARAMRRLDEQFGVAEDD